MTGPVISVGETEMLKEGGGECKKEKKATLPFLPSLPNPFSFFPPSFFLFLPPGPLLTPATQANSTALLYPAYENNSQTRGGLVRVCATGMYRSIGHVEFPKFQTGIFVEWKAPIIF